MDAFKSSSPIKASKVLSMDIVLYVALTLLREERRDPMVWLSKHLPNLFKKERKVDELTSKKKSSKDNPYGWMSDAFLGIFKKKRKKKIEIQKGVFKISPNPVEKVMQKILQWRMRKKLKLNK